MKPRSNRLGMYADIRAILDAALAAGGGTYECESTGQAIHWRQRAYRFRKLYAELLGPSQESPYDTLTMPRCDGPTVSIVLRRQVGRFTPNNEPVEVSELLGDDLLDEALSFAKKLGDN